jgi:ubiquinone/menaquinone biosynthesis C-methylase UbiE
MEEMRITKHHHNERVYSRGVEYLRSAERTERLEVERVAELAMNTGTKSVLDIGTGSALFAEAFRKLGIKVSGIDRNPEMIEVAKKYVPDGDFQKASAENIPYGNNSFDLTFFGVVFHEVDNFSKALSEAFRVSVQSTSILEWNYKVEDFGPPLEHRLKSEFIKKLAEDTGYKAFEEIRMKYLVLYNLKK